MLTCLHADIRTFFVRKAETESPTVRVENLHIHYAQQQVAGCTIHTDESTDIRNVPDIALLIEGH